MTGIGDQIVWGLIFRRNLMEVEGQFPEMLAVLNGDESQQRLWMKQSGWGLWIENFQLHLSLERFQGARRSLCK